MTQLHDRRACLGLAVGALGLFESSASAQSGWPDRPIRIVVPFAPGGVNDTAARPLAERLQGRFGTVVIENVGGAGGSVGAMMVARAKPDGYTLLLGGAATHVVNPLAATRTTYDPLRDFEPIVITALTGLGIAVTPGFPATTLAQLIERLKADGAGLSYASAGAGSAGHLGFELMKSLIATPGVAHVAYRGAAPALNDIVAGHIPTGMASMGSQVIELHRSGQIRLLAVTTPKRMAAIPELPTAEEAGLPGMVSQSFVGLFAPAGTPRPIIERIAEATRAALADPDFQRTLLANGFEPVPDSTPDSARSFVHREIEHWRPIIRRIDLRL